MNILLYCEGTHRSDPIDTFRPVSHFHDVLETIGKTYNKFQLYSRNEYYVPPEMWFRIDEWMLRRVGQLVGVMGRVVVMKALEEVRGCEWYIHVGL